MSDLTTPFIEETLPKQFIYDLGLYLQTCAHIEVAVCTLICTIEAKREGGVFDQDRLHALRKLKIEAQLVELKKAALGLETDPADLVSGLSDWIKRYQQNRHIAAHGAFFVQEGGLALKVFYTHKRKDHGSWVYYPEETTITRELVLELIADADRILRTVAGLEIAINLGDVR